MSHRRDMKRAAAGGYPGDTPPTTTDPTVARVQSLLRTWKLFGTGGEDNAITELGKALHSSGGAARYAVVELPEPVRSDEHIAEDLDDPFEFRAPWSVYYAIRGNVESDAGPAWSPACARIEAAALLAAADRAEAQQ